MYLKLGRQNLQYYQDTSDWVIMAEVVDSSLSFETPILVRNTDELDIWFGRNFPDYNYMKELVQNGNTQFGVRFTIQPQTPHYVLSVVRIVHPWSVPGTFSYAI